MAPKRAPEPDDAWLAAARALAGQPADLSSLEAADPVGFALHHGIGPLLLEHFRSGNVTGLSDDTIEAFRQEALHQAANDLALNHATRALLELLGQKQIDALVLKGGALAARVYPEGRLRPRCDTDIWISRRSAAQVLALLADHGYRIVNDDLGERSRKQFQATRTRLDGEPLWFDVHYRLGKTTLK